MLLMVEKGIRCGICHVMHEHEKSNNKYMKKYNKDEEESFLEYLDANNLYGWAMSQKLPVDCFKWEKNMLKFNEEFIKNYDEDSEKGYILEVDVEYPKSYSFHIWEIFHIIIFHFCQRKEKLIKSKSFYVIYLIRKTMLFI